MKKVLRNAGETIRFVNSMIDFVKIRKEVLLIKGRGFTKKLDMCESRDYNITA